MDISKISKPSNSEASESLQKEASQESQSTAEITSSGFEQSDVVETVKSNSTNLFEAFPADASPSPPLNVIGSPQGTTVLGSSGEKSEQPVSESYAAQKEEGAAPEKANSYSSIRKEIAGALGVAENDPVVNSTYIQLVVAQGEKAEAARIESAQQIINDALMFGRREEVPTGSLNMTSFKEFVPTTPGDPGSFFVRWGFDEVIKGFFSDETHRMTRYLGNGGVLGTVWSVIKDGMETVTKIDEAIPGTLGLKPGDTRTLPDPTNTAAGLKPSTFDPQPDGRYGTASGGQNNTSQPSSSEDKGSSGLGGGSVHDADFIKFMSAEAKEGKSAATPSASAATPSEGNPETRAGAVHVYHKEGSGEWEDRGVQWTENPPTQVTVEEPETDESLAEEEEVEAGGDDNQAAWGDYADTGPALPAQQGVTEKVSNSSGRSGYAAAETRVAFTADGKSLLQDTSGYADKPGGPIDYGDPTDPNAPSDFKDGANVVSHFGLDPTVTDPGQGEGGDESATLDSSIRLDMAGTLRDGGNPLDPFAPEAPAGKRPNTTDAEHGTGDDFLP